MKKLLILLTLLIAFPVQAQERTMAPSMPEEPDVKLIGPVRILEEGVLYALSIDLAPGWHTYWHDPGEVGVAPRFDWAGSWGIEEIAILWPQPEQLLENGYKVNGYHGLVILPMIINGPNPQPKLVLDYAICDEICIPLQATITTVKRPTDLDVMLIDDALSRVPTEPSTE